MSYKTILVHVDPGKHSEKRLETAIRLAREHDACLVGICVFSPYTPPGYIVVQMGAEIMKIQQEMIAGLMSRTEAAFHRQTSSAGLKELAWHTVQDDPVQALSSHARYADIVVIGQSDAADDSGVAMDFPERLVLTAGRPVLILPHTDDFTSIGKRVLVAWNTSQEATRAISNALPFFRSAESVHIMAVNPEPGGNGTTPSENIVRYLARHGVRAEANDIHGAEIDVGNELLSRASDFSADLLVMGCYGHSRLREWVLGGATRTILKSMTTPVLMSH